MQPISFSMSLGRRIFYGVLFLVSAAVFLLIAFITFNDATFVAVGSGVAAFLLFVLATGIMRSEGKFMTIEERGIILHPTFIQPNLPKEGKVIPWDSIVRAYGIWTSLATFGYSLDLAVEQRKPLPPLQDIDFTPKRLLRNFIKDTARLTPDWYSWELIPCGTFGWNGEVIATRINEVIQAQRKDTVPLESKAEGTPSVYRRTTIMWLAWLVPLIISALIGTSFLFSFYQAINAPPETHTKNMPVVPLAPMDEGARTVHNILVSDTEGRSSDFSVPSGVVADPTTFEYAGYYMKSIGQFYKDSQHLYWVAFPESVYGQTFSITKVEGGDPATFEGLSSGHFDGSIYARDKNQVYCGPYPFKVQHPLEASAEFMNNDEILVVDGKQYIAARDTSAEDPKHFINPTTPCVPYGPDEKGNW